MTDDKSPRLIGRKEAADYCGIGESTFSLWVSTHKMPPAIAGTRKWDKRAIDARLDEISGIEQENLPSSRPSSKDHLSEPSNYDVWKAGKIQRREKYKPQLGLDSKTERILRFMADHPDCDTFDSIPTAGATTMDQLIEAGAVRLTGAAGSIFRYGITEEGKAELHRLKKWKALTP